MLRHMHPDTPGMQLCTSKALSLGTGVVGTSSPAAKVTALRFTHRFTLQASRLHSCSKFNTCMYIYIYIYIYIHAYGIIRICTYVNVCIYVIVHIYIYTYERDKH